MAGGPSVHGLCKVLSTHVMLQTITIWHVRYKASALQRL